MPDALLLGVLILKPSLVILGRDLLVLRRLDRRAAHHDCAVGAKDDVLVFQISEVLDFVCAMVDEDSERAVLAMCLNLFFPLLEKRNRAHDERDFGRRRILERSGKRRIEKHDCNGLHRLRTVS